MHTQLNTQQSTDHHTTHFLHLHFSKLAHEQLQTTDSKLMQTDDTKRQAHRVELWSTKIIKTLSIK